MQRKFSHAFHVPGTLGANLNIIFKAPSNCTLVHVSAVSSNDSDATIIAGTTTDDNGYIEEAVIGDSEVPAEFEDLTDFDGALALDQYPRISNGDIVQVIIDYDGDAGTAANDLTVVLTFVEG